MSRIIKLKDEVYLLLKEQADKGGRTLAGQVSYMLNRKDDEFAGASEATGSFACCENKQIRCKHWQYNLDAGEYTNTITGEVREPELL